MIKLWISVFLLCISSIGQGASSAEEVSKDLENIKMRLAKTSDFNIKAMKEFSEQKILSLDWEKQLPLVCHRLGSLRAVILGIPSQFEFVMTKRLTLGVLEDVRVPDKTKAPFRKLELAHQGVSQMHGKTLKSFDRLSGFCGVPLKELKTQLLEDEVLSSEQVREAKKVLEEINEALREVDDKVRAATS